MGQKRRETLSKHELQMTLANRVVMYWGIVWLLVFLLPTIVQLVLGQIPLDQMMGKFFAKFWCPILISIFLVPVVVWDSLRFGIRIAGPVYRINRTVSRMADGAPVKPVKLRKTTFAMKPRLPMSGLKQRRNRKSWSMRWATH